MNPTFLFTRTHFWTSVAIYPQYTMITSERIKNQLFCHVDETMEGKKWWENGKKLKTCCKILSKSFISLHMCIHISLVPLDLSTLYHFTFKSKVYENAFKKRKKYISIFFFFKKIYLSKSNACAIALFSPRILCHF